MFELDVVCISLGDFLYKMWKEEFMKLNRKVYVCYISI